MIISDDFQLQQLKEEELIQIKKLMAQSSNSITDFKLKLMRNQQVAAQNIESLKSLITSKSNNIQSLNECKNLDEVLQLNNKFVKYRCMIQNMFNPELYTSFLIDKNIFNPHSCQKQTIIDLRFQELYNLEEIMDISEENFEQIIDERVPMFCVPIPFMNQWCNQPYNQVTLQPNDYYQQLKIDCQKSQENQFPCIVKFQSSNSQNMDEKTPKLNQLIEVYGVLSFSKSNQMKEDETFPNFGESIEITYPVNQVPRVQCLYWQEINHSQICGPTKDMDQLEIKENFQQILQLLGQLFQGDDVASKFSLFSILSGVTLKENQFKFGKLIVNLSKADQFYYVYQDQSYSLPQMFNKVVEHLVPLNQHIELTIKSLEQKNYRPVMNFNTNLINPNKLQMPLETFLSVDETTMESGTLTQEGIKNIKALADLIEEQQIGFDFHYYQVLIL